MPVYEYVCRLCDEVVEADHHDRLNGTPCANPSCEGVLMRAFSLFVKSVEGGGGSPGRRVG